MLLCLKIICPLSAAIPHLSWVICLCLCGINQCLIIQSYDLFLPPQRIVLASGKVRDIWPEYSVKRETRLSASFIWRLKSQLPQPPSPFTHLKAEVHRFPETRVRSGVSQQLFLALESSIRQSQLIASFNLGITYFSDLSPSTSPGSCEVEASVIFCEM